MEQPAQRCAIESPEVSRGHSRRADCYADRRAEHQESLNLSISRDRRGTQPTPQGALKRQAMGEARRERERAESVSGMTEER